MTIDHFKERIALRPADAAKALGISPRLLWQLTHDGVVPAVKLGTGSRKIVLYPVSELQAWLQQQAVLDEGGRHDDN